MIHICQRRIIFTFSHSHISFPQTNTIRAIHQRISKQHIQNLTNSNVSISKRLTGSVSFHNHKFLQRSGQTILRRKCHNNTTKKTTTTKNNVKNNVKKNNNNNNNNNNKPEQPESKSESSKVERNSNTGQKNGPQNSVLNELWKELKSKLLQFSPSQKFAFKKVTGVLVLGLWLFYSTKQQFYERHLRTVAGEGCYPKIAEKFDNRNELESELRKQVLKPEYSTRISVVYGQKGVGKTTVMKKVVSEMNQSEKSEKDERGVIYVEAESDPHKFVDNILNAIGYETDWKFTLDNIRNAIEHLSPAKLSAKG